MIKLKASKIQKTLSWIAFGQLLNIVLSLAHIKLVTHYLKPSELGVVGLALSISSILTGIIIDPLTKYFILNFSPVLHTENSDNLYVTKCIISRASAILFFGIALFWGWWCCVSGKDCIVPFLAAAIILTDAQKNIIQAQLLAESRPKLLILINILDSLMRLVFIIICLVIFGANPKAVLFGNLIVGVFLVIIYNVFIYPKNSDVERLKPYPKDIHQKILATARLIIPSNLLANLSEMSSRYIIAAKLGLHEAGIFIACYGIVKRPFGIVSDIGYTAISPTYRSLARHGDKEDAKRLLTKWLNIILLISVIGVIAFFCCRDFVTEFFLSSKYTKSNKLLFKMAIAVGLFNIVSVINSALLIHGLSKAILIGNIICSFSAVCLTLIMAASSGLDGAVWGLAIAYSLQLLYLCHVIIKNQGEIL